MPGRDYREQAFRRMVQVLNRNLATAAILAKQELQKTLSTSGRRGFGKSKSIAKKGGGSTRVKKISTRLKKRAEEREKRQGVVFGGVTGSGNSRGRYLGTTGRAIGGVRIRRGRISEKTGKRAILGLTYPSRPGQPPHRQTGRLHGSIAWRLLPSKTTARVGTNVEYAKPLDMGTRRMAARPWMRPTMKRIMPQLMQVIYRGFQVK